MLTMQVIDTTIEDNVAIATAQAEHLLRPYPPGPSLGTNSSPESPLSKARTGGSGATSDDSLPISKQTSGSPSSSAANGPSPGQEQ